MWSFTLSPYLVHWKKWNSCFEKKKSCFKNFSSSQNVKKKMINKENIFLTSNFFPILRFKILIPRNRILILKTRSAYFKNVLAKGENENAAGSFSWISFYIHATSFTRKTVDYNC